jgi:hypothetical protein
MKPGDLVDLTNWENESSVFLTTSYSSKNIKWYNGEIGIIIGVRNCYSSNKIKVAQILISEGIGEIFFDYLKIV